jgi:hypothetical protein
MSGGILTDESYLEVTKILHDIRMTRILGELECDSR